MVPAALRAKQKQKIAKDKKAKMRALQNASFGLAPAIGPSAAQPQQQAEAAAPAPAPAATAPQPASAAAPSAEDSSYAQFMKEMDGLGAFE